MPKVAKKSKTVEEHVPLESPTKGRVSGPSGRKPASRTAAVVQALRSAFKSKDNEIREDHSETNDNEIHDDHIETNDNEIREDYIETNDNEIREDHIETNLSTFTQMPPPQAVIQTPIRCDQNSRVDNDSIKKGNSELSNNIAHVPNNSTLGNFQDIDKTKLKIHEEQDEDNSLKECRTEKCQKVITELDKKHGAERNCSAEIFPNTLTEHKMILTKLVNQTPTTLYPISQIGNTGYIKKASTQTFETKQEYLLTATLGNFQDFGRKTVLETYKEQDEDNGRKDHLKAKSGVVIIGQTNLEKIEKYGLTADRELCKMFSEFTASMLLDMAPEKRKICQKQIMEIFYGTFASKMTPTKITEETSVSTSTYSSFRPRDVEISGSVDTFSNLVEIKLKAMTREKSDICQKKIMEILFDEHPSKKEQQDLLQTSINTQLRSDNNTQRRSDNNTQRQIDNNTQLRSYNNTQLRSYNNTQLQSDNNTQLPKDATSQKLVNELKRKPIKGTIKQTHSSTLTQIELYYQNGESNDGYTDSMSESSRESSVDATPPPVYPKQRVSKQFYEAQLEKKINLQLTPKDTVLIPEAATLRNRYTNKEAEGKSQTTHKVQESNIYKSAESVSCKKESVLLSKICIVAVVSLVFVGLIFSQYYSNIFSHKENDLNISAIMSDLKDKFPQQPPMTLKIVENAIKGLVSPQPKAPAIITLLASFNAIGDAQRFAQYLASTIASSKYSIEIDGEQFRYESPDSAKYQVDKLIDNGLDKNRLSALLINRLDFLPSEAALILHTYCDHEHAPFKRSILLFTVPSEVQLQKDSAKQWDKVLQQKLYDAWHDTGEDQVSALLTRLTVHVAAIFSKNEGSL